MDNKKEIKKRSLDHLSPREIVVEDRKSVV